MTTETLYVNVFTSINEEWTEVGANPWLNDSTANYIYTKADNKWHEEFTFADSAVGTGTINSVDIYLEIQGNSGRNDRVEIHLHDGSSWSNVYNQDPDNDSYQWYNYDVGSILDSWAKIDAAKLKVQYQRAGSPATQEIYIRRCYIYVDYTSGPTPGQFNKLVYATEPPVPSAWNKLAYASEPPTTSSWNKLKYG